MRRLHPSNRLAALVVPFLVALAACSSDESAGVAASGAPDAVTATTSLPGAAPVVTDEAGQPVIAPGSSTTSSPGATGGATATVSTSPAAFPTATATTSPGAPLTLPPTTLPPAAPAAGEVAGGSTTTTAPAGGAGGPSTSTTPGAAAAPTSVAGGGTATSIAGGTSTTAVDDVGGSSAGAAPCDLATIVAQTETGFDGITPGGLHCAGGWAAWSGAADDPDQSDGFLAVAEWSGSAWLLRNLGTAGVCGDGGVPRSLWAALGCTE